jgi:hypothetical protein
VATLAALAGEGVPVESLPVSSPLLAKRCPRCPEKWRAGDRLVIGGVVVFHKECLTTEEDHAVLGT